MKKLIQYIFIVVWFIFINHTYAQIAPVKQWDISYGGTDIESCQGVLQTPDGGYLIGGYSNSGVSGNKTQASRGLYDFLLIKVNASGIKQWEKAYGGSMADALYSLKPTTDGGYILGGRSYSNISGEKSQNCRGGHDYWVIKVDSSGNKLWDKTYGGSLDDNLYSVQQTTDGGYLLAGSSVSGISGDKTQGNIGVSDYWIVKLDSLGNKLWDKTYGGDQNEGLTTMQQTVDGGYILGGYSKSGINGNKTQASRGGFDFWIVKLNSSGNIQWDKTYGGFDNDNLTSLVQTSDGGYILGGTTVSGIGGEKSQPLIGLDDFWIVKTDSVGNKLWDKTIGGTGIDRLTVVQQNTDGSYVLGGLSNSDVNGDKSQPPVGAPFLFADFWIVNLDSIGNKIWDKTVGGTIGDGLECLSQTSDGGYIVAGFSYSQIGGDKSQPSYGNTDMWVVKLTPPCVPLSASLLTTCNNSGTTVNVNIAGNQPTLSGSRSWTLTYTINGATQTVTDTASILNLATNATVGTVYSLINIASGSCSKNLTSSFTVQAAPVVNAGPNETIFANSALYQLTGFSPVGGTWSGPGVSATGLFTPSPALIGTQTLTYSFTQNGCTVTATKQITILALTTPPSINLIAPDTLISSIIGDSYEWKFNGSILSHSARKLKATASGLYAVRIINFNGGPSVYSPDYNFVISGRTEDLQNQFSLYPNPTSGLLTLELSTAQPAEVTVFNTLGQQVLQKTVAKTDEKVQLDLSRVTKGIYLVQVQTQKQVVVNKIVVE